MANHESNPNNVIPPIEESKERIDYLYTLKTLYNSLDVLESFNWGHPEMGVSEISERVHLHKSIVFRILYTLKERGYVEQSKRSKKFRLGLKCFEIGARSVNQLGLGTYIQPIIEKLALQVQETVNVGVLDGHDIVYLNKVVPQRPLRIEAQIGARFPAYCTALGKAILAYLPEEELESFMTNIELRKLTDHSISSPDELKAQLCQVRSQGYSWSDQELFEGVVCIGAPIFDRHNKVFAAISVAMLSQRAKSLGYKEDLIRFITQASAEVSAMIRNLSF